jgi:ATP-dependent DNA helicase RecQ
MPDLTSLLQSTFGHSTFRANQEAVCRAATNGRDVLLVMPTGAGKSLCYQLPAIARGGTALVVSPLIALMDDQAAKLSAIGLRVGRIHSGLSRDDSRQACRDYLDGTLNFLFIAPERLRVPGFPKMLARRKPSLIAIDEAHCISAWGHDFRPDYRTLGEHLPALRPAPIIALTATATPTVQRDIVAQLNLADPALFIHGFRRNNLAIEVVEMSKPRRHEFTTQLLSNAANRPAIVYAPSRKSAEELATELNRHFPAAAYHAGLDPGTRERVQTAFQACKLEVVVATIAFGMGIDKADVRTVVHTALPSSVEAFYQEIGRAGRDGLPSRTVLLHSYADRKMHEFFLERDYPPASDLARIAQLLTEEFLMPEPLAQRLQMGLDTFNKAIEKLIAQGAASIDLAGNVRRAGNVSAKESWRAGYDAQIAFRRSQLDRMVAFAETQQCRMTAIIRHFGDTSDATIACGKCDVCNPTTSTAQSYHQPDSEELRQLSAVLHALEGQSRSTGKLHTELADGVLRGTPAAKDRKAFDPLLDALARAALVNLVTDTFTNSEGNVINYRKASLTHEGREAAASGSLQSYEILVKDAAAQLASSGSASKSAKSSASRPSKASLKAQREQITASYTLSQRSLDDRLRAWRKAEAARTGKPAFMVFGDSVLHAIILASPVTIPALRAISSVSPRMADKSGAEIIAICRDAPPALATIQGPTSLSSFHPELSRSHAEQPAAAVQGPPRFCVSATNSGGVPVPSFHRSHTPPDPTESLTPDQRMLDTQLRAWRKAESERIGLPQFFVLGSSALRSIVLIRPRTLAQLQTIAGIGPDKAAKFGASIVNICAT